MVQGNLKQFKDKMASFMSGLLFTALFIAAVNADELTKEAILKEQVEVQLKCSNQYNVPENYFELYVQGGATESKHGKCFMKCGLTEIGILNRDGSLNVPRIQQISKVYFDKPEEQNASNNSWTKCDGESHSESYKDDSCDRAWNLALCKYTAMKKAGFDFKNDQN